MDKESTPPIGTGPFEWPPVLRSSSPLPKGSVLPTSSMATTYLDVPSRTSLLLHTVIPTERRKQKAENQKRCVRATQSPERVIPNGACTWEGQWSGSSLLYPVTVSPIAIAAQKHDDASSSFCSSICAQHSAQGTEGWR